MGNPIWNLYEMEMKWSPLKSCQTWRSIYIVVKCYDGWEEFIHGLNTNFVIFQMFMTVSIILWWRCDYLFMRLSTDRWESTVKFRKWAPGLIFFKDPFWGAYFLRGLSTDGNLRFKINWASLIVGSKFTFFALFYFVFEGNFPSTSPQGLFGGLVFGEAYTWRGLFSESYSMLQDDLIVQTMLIKSLSWDIKMR